MARQTRIGRLAKPAAFAAVSAAVLLTACDRSGVGSEAFWRARKLAADPEQLWSMQVQDQKDAGGPIRICTDSQLRSGLVQPQPAVAGTPCAIIGKPFRRPGYYSYRCELAGRTWMVSSRWTGDLARDVTAEFVAEDLDPPHLRLRQVRRLRLIGPCPAGWPVGEATDQQGRRRPVVDVGY